MLCVICPLPERRIVETDELFVNDGGLARVATWSKALCERERRKSSIFVEKKKNDVFNESKAKKETNLMVI